MFLALTLFMSSCFAPNENLPRESFVLIRVDLEETKCTDCYSENLALSSGFVIAESTQGGTYILTAGHVCDSSDITDLYGFIKNQNFEISFSAENKYYNSSAKVIDMDLIDDLCLLKVETMFSKPVRISNHLPKKGERVYNLAAPLGIYNKNFMLEFEGFFAGEDGYGNSIYSIPAKPGSSGSPIFDKKGNLIGMIHSSALKMENISISSELGTIRNYLKEQAAINSDMKIYLR